MLEFKRLGALKRNPEIGKFPSRPSKSWNETGPAKRRSSVPIFFIIFHGGLDARESHLAGKIPPRPPLGKGGYGELKVIF